MQKAAEEDVVSALMSLEFTAEQAAGLAQVSTDKSLFTAQSGMRAQLFFAMLTLSACLLDSRSRTIGQP